ncbi:putative ABC transport system permease protein [Allocatelliglobosispora scoriae]|uniref:Putative ABC transport system permease protein n=1 Tax=Allocatelliglobosispora scoriae TaxID=643052 RepID=A0A841BKX2_9ACTN|nr:ABC transporter permease [Allocatelliglobosispora scoriae]MBB5867511.1 putative ABC transport system permease protein [Allocatelliglobosispora scoriae]
MTILWLSGLVRRRTGRMGGAVAGVAAAVALLGSLGVFLAASQATMTARATARVAVDWQIQVAPGADPAAVAAAAMAEAGTDTALPVGFVRLPTGLASSHNGARHTTGAAVVLGLPDGYRDRFPGQFRTLDGADGGVLIAQQTAANLHAAPGSTITIARPQLPPFSVTVSGVVDMPQANSLFQVVGGPPGAQPSAPPDNVLLLPATTFRDLTAQLAATHPELLSVQIHIARADLLPAAPAAAYTVETAAAHHLDAVLAGDGQVGDNLAATLDAARKDAAYATVLFVFLGLPGALLAAAVTSIVAATGAARRRRDHALARTRGATTGALLRLVLAEAGLVGFVGGAAGLGAAAGIGRLEFGSASFGATPATAAVWAAAAFGAGLLIAVATVAWPVWSQLRSDTVRAARTTAAAPVRRAHPVWILILAVISFAIWRSTQSTGYALVLAPEGVASISIDYWAFAAPALLWITAGLSAYWLTIWMLTVGAPVLTALLRLITGRLASTATATLTRQRHLIAQTVTVLALTLAFAATTATFNATYRAQAAVDARLTNGADVTVTTTGPADLAAIAGVTHIEPLQHRYAYIGADLQDLYGVRPATIGTTGLQDGWFEGGTAAELMRQLAAQPDGILVAAETVIDYQLQPGDTITLRVNTGGRPVAAAFHYVGIVKEFPTAPSDSFFVANADYLDHAVGAPVTSTALVTTDGTDPAQVAAAVRQRLGAAATVTDIGSATTAIGSSLTAVDLAGLTRIELVLALLLAATASGLLLALTLAERRRTFTLAALLGADRRQLTGFVAAESATVGILALTLGALIATAVTGMLLSVLTGVFDPPPDQPTVAWRYLAAVVATMVASLALATAITVRASARPDPAHIRRP